MNFKYLIQKVVTNQDLTIEEAKVAMTLMLNGDATSAQIGSFLTALRMKSETLDEIIGCATVLKEKAEHIKPNVESYVDVVGTGGDGSNTFNISTTSAFVAAGAGVRIAKHGNRAVSSKSGSADVLEALGINIMLEPNDVEKCVEEIGIGFMFAQIFHKTMKNVSMARSEMGIRSIFNILGPLSNPSDAKVQVIGVFNPKLTDPFAQAMRAMGVERAIVMNGLDGMDEITTSSDTVVSEIVDGRIINYTLTPEQFGFERVMREELTGRGPKINALITKDILLGTKGPKRDIVLFNSGAVIYAANKASSIQEGIEMAEESIDSGKALEKLNQLIEFTW